MQALRLVGKRAGHVHNFKHRVHLAEHTAAGDELSHHSEREAEHGSAAVEQLRVGGESLRDLWQLGALAGGAHGGWGAYGDASRARIAQRACAAGRQRSGQGGGECGSHCD